MFGYTSDLSIEESLFSGLYVIISRTEGTSDALYNSALTFLNTNFSSFSVRKLLSNYLADDEFSLSGKLYFTKKVRLGPTEILWPVEKANSTPREALLNNAKSLSILERNDILSHLTEDSSVDLKFISEEKFNSLFIPKLFYPGNVIAIVILNDETLDYSSLIDVFYEKKSLYGDNSDKFQFLLSVSGDHTRDQLLESFDKHLVKNRLHKFTQVNHVYDPDLTYDSFFLIDKHCAEVTQRVYAVLGEIVLNLLITIVSQLLTLLDDPKYSLENIRKSMTHSYTRRGKSYSGSEIKRSGDVNLILGNNLTAICHYVCANYYFTSENNQLSHAQTLFTLSVTLFKLFNLRGRINSVSSQTVQSLNKFARGKTGKSVYELLKLVIERPVEYLLNSLKKSFLVWLSTSDCSEELQLLFIFYTKLLADSALVIPVISSFVTYCKRLPLEQQLNVIQYVVDLLQNTKYKRKLHFYQHLKDFINCETQSNGSNLRETEDKDLEVLLGGVTKCLEMTTVDPMALEMIKYYKNWYQINNSIINTELSNLRYSSDIVLVKRVLTLKLCNILQSIEEHTAKVDISPPLNELKSYAKLFNLKYLTLSHLIIRTHYGQCDSVCSVCSVGLDDKLLYFGGYEGVRLGKFPLICSMELSRSDLHFRFSSQNLKKINTINNLTFHIVHTRKCKLQCEHLGFHIRTKIKSKLYTNNTNNTTNTNTVNTVINVNNVGNDSTVINDLEDLVVYADRLLTVEVGIINPLAVDLMLKDVELVGSGVPFDTVKTNFIIPGFSRNYRKAINLRVKEEGTLCVLGVKFTLFDFLTCFQLLVNLDNSDPNSFITTLKSCETGNFTQFLSVYGMKIRCVKDCNKCEIGLFSTEFKDKVEFITAASVSNTPNTLLSSRTTTHRSISTGTTSSITSTRTTNSTGTTNSITSTNSIISITNLNGDGGLCKSVLVCSEELCVDCSVLEQLMSNMSEFTQNSPLLTGDRSLIYVKLSNKNKRHKFTNITVSVLPHVPEPSVKSQPLTAKDYLQFQLLQQKLKQINQVKFSIYLHLFAGHTIKHSVHNDLVGVGLQLLPGESLYLPLVYVANELFSSFDVVFDYQIGDSGVAGTCDSRLIRGNAYKSVNFNVEKSIDVQEHQFVPVVHFNHRLFRDNINLFKNYYSSSTLQSLKNSKVKYDNKWLRMFFKVNNESDKLFSCKMGNLEFISNPNTSNRYHVDIRKLPYKDNHRKYQILNLFNSIHWSCNGTFGSIKIFDPGKSVTSTELGDNTPRLTGKSKLAQWYKMCLERLIPMNELICSKLSIKMLITVDGRVMAGDALAVGKYFTVNVLAKNNGTRPIADYKVVIIPFTSDLYTNVENLLWSGSLEQVGLELLTNSLSNCISTTRPYRTVSGDVNGVDMCNGVEWECYSGYKTVATAELVVKQPCKLSINAAILNSKLTLFHHKLHSINFFTQ